MSTTVLRLGLWTLILVLAAYVVRETFAEQAFAELITTGMLTPVLILSGILLVAGLVLRVLGIGAKAVVKNRCRVCRTPIPAGAMYCRAHLRSILYEEDEKTHSMRIPRDDTTRSRR
jgi:hypothetical protein